MGVVDQCPIPCYPKSHIPRRTAGVPTLGWAEIHPRYPDRRHLSPPQRNPHRKFTFPESIRRPFFQTWISDRLIGNGNQAHTHFACSAFAKVFIRELKHV
ncbi:hypothetical protein QQF64_030921 [Cirrhinus molitorella]|uniref:Uncharacterized protein n=1 Tax=Cirrhinus molitorella TaxID=172907 RepID=A0ABR3N4Q3_9TELE